MSRYQLDSEKYDIFVGWDHPMRSFFAVVENPDIPEDSDEDYLVAWIGDGYDEIKSVKRLQELIAPYGRIPEDIVTKLVTDSEEPFTPTALQLATESLFAEED